MLLTQKRILQILSRHNHNDLASKQIIEFEIASALNDGGIKQDELGKIYILKRELNLSDEYVNILIKLLSEKSN